MKPFLLLAYFADYIEVVPRRYFQLIRRRLREVSRRRRQFGFYFGWFNLNSQMVVNETRRK